MIDCESLDKNNQKAARIAQAFLEQSGTWEGQTFLDIGCGDGGATRYIAEQLHLTTTGIDVDSEKIAEAQSESVGIPNLTFQVADAERLPFENASFDFIFCCKAMHHILHWRTAVQEMVRVLKPGGYLCISDIRFPYCWEFIKSRVRGKLGPFPTRKQIETTAAQYKLHQESLRKRFSDYDVIWQKTN